MLIYNSSFKKEFKNFKSYISTDNTENRRKMLKNIHQTNLEDDEVTEKGSLTWKLRKR
jgi:hypothetical protein